MMARKEFEIVADEFAKAFVRIGDKVATDPNSADVYYEMLTAFYRAAEKSNPRFDVTKFQERMKKRRQIYSLENE